MKNNRAIAAIVILILVAIYALFVYSLWPSGREEGPAADQISDQTLDRASSTDEIVAASSTPTTTEKAKTTTKTQPKPAAGAVSQSYTDALKTYSASGYRFQIVNCQMTPLTLVVKKGSTFMIDNRDNQSHKISVGNATYSIGSYNFTIATAKTLGSYYVRCDSRGSAKITVVP